MEPNVSRRVAIVDSFAALSSRAFGADGINALCWPRALDGDFAEVARLLAPPTGLVEVDVDALRTLTLSQAGRTAADVMLSDMNALADLGREPVLNCITSYPRDERALPIATDVMSFHADSAPIDSETWLCTYYGKSSEGLDNDDARRLVDDPGIRAQLLAHYGGVDDEQFAELLSEGAFDQHYAIGERPGARPFSFGVGNLWRIAVAWPGSPVLPCLHRAPLTSPGDEPRLLLIC